MESCSGAGGRPVRSAAMLRALLLVVSFLGAAAASAAQDVPRFDLVIRGGTVVDGRDPAVGDVRFVADVGISAGRIAAIGDLAGAAAERTIDATGRIVAPGRPSIQTCASVGLAVCEFVD